ncbi:hypothetical protein NPIL_157441 [Nephila pilipes]|uniref:Uncharacterized protein n=1 Tax=Nephila pilipes TaxID=299642 RepID=A0A8X6QDV5_NEPPI|nr:hypothetical protein NPIL_157441 [Nephila pilipes]
MRIPEVFHVPTSPSNYKHDVSNTQKLKNTCPTSTTDNEQDVSSTQEHATDTSLLPQLTTTRLFPIPIDWKTNVPTSTTDNDEDISSSK